MTMNPSRRASEVAEPIGAISASTGASWAFYYYYY